MIYECHGHIILDGVSYNGVAARHKNGVDEKIVRENLRICAENGIGFYRDGGDKLMVSAHAKKLAAEYGIDYRTPVYVIHKKGHYGGLFGRAFENIKEYRELITAAKRTEADFIKLTASGMLDFTGGGGVTGSFMPFEELCEMIKIANGEGFAVMIHANGAESIKNALEAGASSIEHGFYIDDEAIRMLAHSGAVWIPTCTAVANLIDTKRYNDKLLKSILDGHKAALVKAYAEGVLIASGSDAGAACVPQGQGAIDECDILKELGIDLECGNRRVAELFRRH